VLGTTRPDVSIAFERTVASSRPATGVREASALAFKKRGDMTISRRQISALLKNRQQGVTRLDELIVG